SFLLISKTPPPARLYTLSLHDALPIYRFMSVKTNIIGFNTIVIREIGRIMRIWAQTIVPPAITATLYFVIFGSLIGRRIGEMGRSEEHTSELQSRENLVCRLLLEKKKE